MDCRLNVLLATVTFLACVWRCVGEEPTAQPCQECAKRKADEVLTKEQLRQARIELLKRQILQKLRLSEPPKPSRPVIPPRVITTEGILSNQNEIVSTENNIDDYYGTTENVVLLPDNTSEGGIRRWGVPSTSLRFHLDQLTSLTPGKPTAHLWVYRNQQTSSNVTYVLYDIQPATGNTERQVRMIHVDHVTEHSLPSWHKYDITPSLGVWLRTGRSRTFDIDCHGCLTDPIDNSADNRPFIVVSADLTRNLRRKRRNIECSSGTTYCCREEFYLSFVEIGWNDWIIQPTGYKANFCRGSCEDDVSISRYHHTSLLQQVIQGQRSKNINVTVSLCCTPSNMSSLMLLYIGQDGQIYQKRLPNMVVEACDCA